MKKSCIIIYELGNNLIRNNNRRISSVLFVGGWGSFSRFYTKMAKLCQSWKVLQNVGKMSKFRCEELVSVIL